MTKEELYSLIDECARDYAYDSAKDYLDEFFESNVCVPKGENRHLYADVLHEWVEGIPCEWLDKSQDKFINLLQVNEYHPREYRIKPYEPIYEWQWCVILADGTGSIYGYHTEKDINEIFPKQNKFKMQNTQRERT